MGCVAYVSLIRMLGTFLNLTGFFVNIESARVQPIWWV
jgi:hypothetical protein